jgi:Na+-transporting NADH:ubiquinone oxidoreductase subunit C
MQQFSTRYTYIFSFGLCLICSILLSVAAVALKERQAGNMLLDKQKSVLMACNMVKPGDSMSPTQIREMFATIEPVVIDLDTDAVAEDVDPANFDTSAAPLVVPPDNAAQIKEMPRQVQIFKVMKDGKVDMLVLPIFGKGLWGTLYGFLAVSEDTNTVEGITYYDHKETPGLGGEVDNPTWKNKWPHRQLYDENWNVAIEVIKGPAGSVADDPHSIDGLSGATITSRGVTNMLNFWLGEEGFGPYLKTFREQGSV